MFKLIKSAFTNKSENTTPIYERAQIQKLRDFLFDPNAPAVNLTEFLESIEILKNRFQGESDKKFFETIPKLALKDRDLSELNKTQSAISTIVSMYTDAYLNGMTKLPDPHAATDARLEVIRLADLLNKPLPMRPGRSRLSQSKKTTQTSVWYLQAPDAVDPAESSLTIEEKKGSLHSPVNTLDSPTFNAEIPLEGADSVINPHSLFGQSSSVSLALEEAMVLTGITPMRVPVTEL